MCLATVPTVRGACNLTANIVYVAVPICQVVVPCESTIGYQLLLRLSTAVASASCSWGRLLPGQDKEGALRLYCSSMVVETGQGDAETR